MTDPLLPTDPWYHATQDKRTYITPEDIADAIVAGADLHELRLAVLIAISKRSCEDYTLCAFIAARGTP